MAAERTFAVVREGRLVALPKGIDVSPGDIVAFETTDIGILLVPQNAELNAALDKLGAALLDGGRDLETLIEDGREIRDELLLVLQGDPLTQALDCAAEALRDAGVSLDDLVDSGQEVRRPRKKGSS